MDSQNRKLHNSVNHAIIKCRGVYSQWAKRTGVNYNRMLVFYTIRDYGYCMQKQMCDQYLLPLFWLLAQLGLDFTWFAFPISEVVSGGVGLLLYRRVVRQWQRAAQ